MAMACLPIGLSAVDACLLYWGGGQVISLAGMRGAGLICRQEPAHWADCQTLMVQERAWGQAVICASHLRAAHSTALCQACTNTVK